MIHLLNRFVTKIRTDKSNESILLELSMPTYANRDWLLVPTFGISMGLGTSGVYLNY
jgi:hypothetical protein